MPLLRRPHSITPDANPRGFTLVELLVVIAIIGVLVGLILPAIGGATKRSHKTSELNHLKQLGHAWMLYGNNNNDAALPGFLDTPVQMPPVAGVSRGWGVTYQYPNKTDIPINANNDAGPWTWRLLSYVDFAHDLIHGYKDDDEFSMVGVASDAAESHSIAYEPAFGYNAYYIGGYWTMDNSVTPILPRYRFFDSKDVNAPNPRVIVATSISRVQRSSDVVVFCTSSHFDTIGAQIRLPNDRPGSHLVTPPFLADVPQWQAVAQDRSAMETLNICDAPMGRHTGNPAIMYADGHVDTQTYGELMDMRHWIDSASRYDYRHTP